MMRHRRRAGSFAPQTVHDIADADLAAYEAALAVDPDDTTTDDPATYTLSIEEVEALGADIWPEWAPVSPLSPHTSHVRPVTALDARSAVLTRQAVEAAEELNRIAGSNDPRIRSAAAAALGQVQAAIRPPKEVFLVKTGPFPLGRRVDDFFGLRKDKLRHAVPPTPATGLVWTFIGLALSALAGALVAFDGLWFLPAVIVGLRQFLTLRLGGQGTLPFEGPALGTGARAIYRCWATHFSDVLVLAGFVAYGAMHSQLLGAVAIIGIICVLFGVILRTSALQLAIQINRLNLERIVRPWPPLLALIVAYFLQRNETLILCVGIVLGPLSYGVGEILRSTIRIHRELGGGIGARTITISSSDILSDGTTVMANRTRTIDMVDGWSVPSVPRQKSA